MSKIKALIKYFSFGEWLLWLSSIAAINISFLLFDRENFLTLTASIIGVTSLIFNAKGNPIGQILMMIFSAFYGFISFTFAYYGEMITYLGMTAPMALIALISWIRNPYKGNYSEVTVNRIKGKEFAIIGFLTASITIIFYFILLAFNTTYMIPSTLSVATSFAAVYLTFRRSEYFALAYALNDIVLIILWVLASLHNTMYISVVICFAAFLVNDIYGFISWRKMHIRQQAYLVKL